MKKLLLFLGLGALLSGCNPQQPCQDTALQRSAQVNWDEIPNYATRGCKVAPGQNRFSPLWRAATGINKEAGLVYFKIEILEDCKNDNWYNEYYWLTRSGYLQDVLVPENKRFRLTIEYQENCLADCYIPTNFTSATFRSQQIFEPGTWKASDLKVMVTPQYVSQELPCTP